MNTNVRHLAQGSTTPAFYRPGFEGERYLLEHHHLTDLLTTAQLARIDASARIRERDPLTPQHNLVDLEHARLRALMLDEKFPGMKDQTSVQVWCDTRANLSGELQRKQRFRKDPQGRRRYGLLLNEDDEIEFRRFEREGGTTLTNKLKHDIQLESGPRINFWGEPDYEVALEVLAESLGMETAECARKFGVVDLPEKGCEQGWYYHPSLGFSRYK